MMSSGLFQHSCNTEPEYERCGNTPGTHVEPHVLLVTLREMRIPLKSTETLKDLIQLCANTVLNY